MPGATSMNWKWRSGAVARTPVDWEVMIEHGVAFWGVAWRPKIKPRPSVDRGFGGPWCPIKYDGSPFIWHHG